MSQKKYASLQTLQTFLVNLKDIFDTKGSSDVALKTANTYTDNAVSQKAQVQIITWEEDD